jgi:putative copper resistance protein D
LDAALAACRWALYTSTGFVFGATSYVCVLVPATLRPAIIQRLHASITVAIVVSTAAAMFWLPLQAAQIAGTWAGAFDVETSRGVVFDTYIGHVWQLRVVLSLLLLLALALPMSRRAPAAAVISGLLLASLALVGHAAMRSGLPGTFQRLNDALHLLSGGAWLGALIPLRFCLSAINEATRRHDALLAVRRFSAAGHVAVAVLILTGIVSSALVLGRWPTDLSSPYQAVLVCKILAAGAMIGLALVNRYVLQPRFARQEDATTRSIKSGALAEVALGTLVLALVSVLGMLDPAAARFA